MLNNNDTGRVKKGNGVEYLRHQEQVAIKKNLTSMKPTFNNLDNVYYTSQRDQIEDQLKRLKKMKDNEILNQNEKMYNRLLKILNSEKRSLSK